MTLARALSLIVGLILLGWGLIALLVFFGVLPGLGHLSARMLQVIN